jgi:hypothetical protein
MLGFLAKGFLKDGTRRAVFFQEIPLSDFSGQVGILFLITDFIRIGFVEVFIQHPVRAASPPRSSDASRFVAGQVNSRQRRYLRARPKHAVEQPGERASGEDREPRTEPNGNRDWPQGPSWQAVHGIMSPRYIGRGHRALAVIKELLLSGPARTPGQHLCDRRACERHSSGGH